MNDHLPVNGGCFGSSHSDTPRKALTRAKPNGSFHASIPPGAKPLSIASRAIGSGLLFLRRRESQMMKTASAARRIEPINIRCRYVKKQKSVGNLVQSMLVNAQPERSIQTTAFAAKLMRH